MFRFKLSHGPPISRERIRAEVLERYVELGRVVARRFVRGNINIKDGRFMTDRDLEKRKDDLRKTDKTEE
jgi:hypothetical protein